MTTDTPVLALNDIRKQYGPVKALDGVSFHINEGEVVGLVGDNGAGKSSLAKVMAGASIPNSGSIRFCGKDIALKSPLEARGLGIETVYQELAVIPQLDVESNLYMGREIRGSRWWNFMLLDKKRMRAEALVHIRSLNVGLKSAQQQVGVLSGGQRQSVAVARAICWGKKVVIMDEPTAALGVRESQGVIDLIKRVRDRGIAVVLISHNMPRVFELTDRIFVMRQGKCAGNVRTHDTSMNKIVSLITGAHLPPGAG